MVDMNLLQTVGRTELLAFVAGVMVVAAIAVSSGPSPASEETEALTWDNHITVKHNGEEIAHFHNTLTDQGKNWILDQISDAHVTSAPVGSNASYIAVGNGSDVTEGDTVLAKEIQTGGLSRAPGTVKTYGAGNFSVENQFDATADIGVVNTTSLNWDGGAGTNTIISGGAFGTEANLVDGDQLTVIHNITIS